MKFSKLLAFIALMLIQQSLLWGTAGLWRGSLDISLNGSTTNYKSGAGTGTTFSGANLGTLSSPSNTLVLVSSYFFSFKNDGCNVTGGQLEYRVYKQGDTPPSYTTSTFSFACDCGQGCWRNSVSGCGTGDQEWGNSSINASLTTGITSSGTYVLQVIWTCFISSCGNSSATIGAESATFEVQAGFLPVELINFQATRIQQEKVKLSWTTATETYNSHFELQRSPDARTWQTLTTVAGAGFSTTLRSYEFLDEKPLPLNFYRLRQVDFDQQDSYSKVISVEFKDARSPRLSPNPAEYELAIDFEEEPEPGSSAQFFDPTGKLSLEASIQPDKKCLFDISQLSPGLYFLKIKGINGEVIWQDRFVKK